jgi:hypothetical protein
VCGLPGPEGGRDWEEGFKVQSELFELALQTESFEHLNMDFKQNHLNMQYVFNTRDSVCTLSARERNWVLLVTHPAINKFILLS